MAEASYNVYKKCKDYQNMELQGYTNFHHPLRFPMLSEVAHLPEEGYTNEQEQQGSLNRDNRNLLPEYRSLCEIVTNRVQLDDSEYEYQPPYYYEVYCKNHSLLDNLQQVANPPKQKCVHPGFHCVQRSKTMFFVRRRWDSECWEPFIKQIASGCDCMWPQSVLGDITDHY